MTAQVRTEFVGVADAVKALRRVDPELRKQFPRDVKQITRPIVTEAQNSYPEEYLSGMTRAWAPRGRPVMPYDQRKARSGVQTKVDTRRGAHAVIAVTQRDAAASIIDMAGKRSSNPLGTALDRFGQPSRVMWPAAERNLPAVERELSDAVTAVMRRTSEELR